MEYNPKQLSEIDSIEIVNLSGLDVTAHHYMNGTESAQCVWVSSETAQEIARLWRELPYSEQMRCHIPPFGLRFYNNGSLLLQASICWQCNNIFGEAGGEKIFYKFDAEHPISQRLLNICEQAFK